VQVRYLLRLYRDVTFDGNRLIDALVDDLGVRQGYGLACGIDPPPTPKVEPVP
jgi:hypothetical protein